MKPRGFESPSMPETAFTPPEGRQHHRIAEGQGMGLRGAAFGHFLDMHRPRLDPRDPGRGDPFDMAAAQRGFEQPLGVAHPVEAKMADIGFGGDEGHGHPVADPASAQGRIEDEGEFVGGPEAARALRRPHHDGAGVFAEPLEGRMGGLGMVDMADGLGVALGSEALDLVEGKLGAGRHHEVIVIERSAVGELHPVLGRHEARGGHRPKGDPEPLHRRRQIGADMAARPPAHRHPRVGGHEMIGGIAGHDSDPVLAAELLMQLVGHDRAAQTGPENDDMRH
ncbi:hypothetical protein RSP03_12880 [Cereibacter sphaeroides]|nr:hypothetical protein RSP03_12880 [Cereibacter sphaeroides]